MRLENDMIFFFMKRSVKTHCVLSYIKVKTLDFFVRI